MTMAIDIRLANGTNTLKSYNMATDLRCPNCYATLGKDKENPRNAWCGTCATSFYNEYGYSEDETD